MTAKNPLDNPRLLMFIAAQSAIWSAYWYSLQTGSPTEGLVACCAVLATVVARLLAGWVWETMSQRGISLALLTIATCFVSAAMTALVGSEAGQ